MLTEHEGQVLWVGNAPADLPDRGLAVRIARHFVVLYAPHGRMVCPLTGGLVVSSDTTPFGAGNDCRTRTPTTCTCPSWAMLLATDPR